MGYTPRERVVLEWVIPIIVELFFNELVTRSGNLVKYCSLGTNTFPQIL